MHEEKGNKIILQHVYGIKEKEKRKLVIEKQSTCTNNITFSITEYIFVTVIPLSLHWQVEQKYHIQHHSPKQSECFLGVLQIYFNTVCCSTDITSLGKQARACSSDIA